MEQNENNNSLENWKKFFGGSTGLAISVLPWVILFGSFILSSKVFGMTASPKTLGGFILLLTSPNVIPVLIIVSIVTLFGTLRSSQTAADSLGAVSIFAIMCGWGWHMLNAVSPYSELETVSGVKAIGTTGMADLWFIIGIFITLGFLAIFKMTTNEWLWKRVSKVNGPLID